MVGFRRCVAGLVAVALVGGCSGVRGDQEEPTPRIVQPGAPGETSRVVDPDEVVEIVVPEHVEADVEFMQMMIRHHAQALRMTRLVPERSASVDLPRFARRIEVSQLDEIEAMQRWLTERGEDVPDVEAGHAHDHAAGSMPGMLSEQEFAELEAASGPEFDRLFLERMHDHHAGALQMVADLFATTGAGEEPEIFRFANDVDADQRIEIARIESLLAELDGR